MATAKTAKKKKNISVRFFSAIGRFFKNTIGEMKRVVWPSGKEVRSNLVIVVIFVVIAALIIFALDFAFSQGVKWLLEWAKNIQESRAAESISDVSSLSEAATATIRWLTM